MDFFPPHKSFVPGNQHNIFQWLYGNECSHRPDLYRWIEGPVSHFVAKSVYFHDEFRLVYFICLDLSSCQTVILWQRKGNSIILLQLHVESSSTYLKHHCPERYSDMPPWRPHSPRWHRWGTIVTVSIASRDTNRTRPLMDLWRGG